MKLAIFILLCIYANFAASDTVDGSYQGWVMDVSDNPIRGVTVRASSSSSSSSVTDRDGCFFVEYKTELDKDVVFEVFLDGYQKHTNQTKAYEAFLHVSSLKIVLSSDGYHKSKEVGHSVGVSKEMAYEFKCTNT